MSRYSPVSWLLALVAGVIPAPSPRLLAVPSVAPAPAPTSGEYFGLLADGTGRAVGSARVVLTNGRGSVALRVIGQAPLVARLTLRVDGSVAVTGSAAAGISLQANSDLLTGSVAVNTTTYPLTLSRTSVPATAAALSGSYTFVLNNLQASALAGQPIAGAAAAYVSPQGRVVFIGALADGTVISQGGTLTTEGEYPWFQQAGSKAIGGRLIFKAIASPAGTATWFGDSQTADLFVSGSHYYSSAVFGANESWTLTAEGKTNDGTSVQIPGLMAVARGFGLQVGGASPAALASLAGTGLAIGRYQTAVGGRMVTRTLLGVPLQDFGLAAGFVRNGNELAGQFQVQPAGYGAGLNPILSYNGRATAASGAAGLIKTASGNLVLTGANIYTGATVVGSGVLALNTGTPIGSGSIVINGGTLVVNPGLPGSQTGPGGGLILTGGTTIGGGPVVNPIGSVLIVNPVIPAGTINSGNLVIGAGTSTGGATITLIPSAGGTLHEVPGSLVGPNSKLTLNPGYFAAVGARGMASDLTLPDGLSVTVLGPLPNGWVLTLGGVAITPGTYVVAGSSGPGSTAVLTFAPVTP